MPSSSPMPIFQLFRLVRDARSTKNSERTLINALAMRCQPAKKFLAWPSYRQLSLDTCLDEVTLKRAAKRLEDANLIRRVVRANRSNCFFVNVPLLQQQAAAVKAADQAAKAQHEVSESPFGEALDAHDDRNDDTDNNGWNGGAE